MSDPEIFDSLGQPATGAAAVSRWGLSAGTQLATSGTVVFSNSNNVSFGLSGSTRLTASIAAIMALSAGTTLVPSGSVVFSNSNGASFGVNGSTVTASHDGLRSVSAGTQDSNVTRLVFSNGSGVSFGMNAGTLTASVAAAGTGNIGAVAGGTQTGSSGTIAFSDSNGLSWGLSGSTRMTGSHDGLRSISAGTQDSNVTRLVFSNSANVSFGLNAGTLTASASYSQSTAPSAFAAGTQTGTSGTLVFANSNGISWGLSGSSQVTASFDGLRSASAGTQDSNVTRLVFSNSNGVSWGLNNGTLTASVGPRLSGFEPSPNANATTILPGQGTWYLQPFCLQQPLASGRLNALWVSYSNSNAGMLRLSNGSSFASNTTGTKALTHQEQWTAAMWSRGAGGNSTQIESFWSNTWGISLTQSVSVVLTAATNVSANFSYSLSYPSAFGSDGGVTLAGATSNGGLSSAAASMVTSALTSAMSSMLNMLSGQLQLPIGFNTTLAPGMYWLGIARSSYQTTSGTSAVDITPIINREFNQGASSFPFRLFGLTVSNTSTARWGGEGIYSAVSSAPPATIQFADVRSVASGIRGYFNIVNITA